MTHPQKTAAAPARATATQTTNRQHPIIAHRRIKRELPPPAPPSGKGIHQWEWALACWARDHGFSPQEAASRILAHDGQLHRRLNPRAVRATVERAFATGNIEFDPLRNPAPRKVAWNEQETARIHREHPATATSLVEASPVPVDTLKPRSLLAQLFPDPDGLLCLARGPFYFYTGPLRGFPYLKTWEFIVPAYMTSQTGETADGKLSYHAKSNTGPRRYIVFDFDDPPPEQHPGIIMHLAKFRPLVLALSSGGKSLHAWFPTTDRPNDDELFWRLGITLGADPVLYRNPSQFVRLPLGTRSGTAAAQSVFYFNPEATTP